MCPECGIGELKHRDFCRRVSKEEGGGKKWYLIPRGKCTHCSKTHRMLPDFMVPFKHYTSEVISGALDGVVTADDLDSENHPCATTISRWHHWLMKNKLRIEGTLKSIGYRLLGFSEGLLKSGESLLERLRDQRKTCWLETLLRFVYNSGNRLEPFRDCDG